MTVWSGLPVALVVLALALAGCGSSSTKSGHARSTAGGARPTGGAHAAGSSATGSVHATFVGANHDPKVIVNWPYTVTAADAHGHPLSGTVLIEFTFGGAVVGRDASGTHHLRHGRWHDTLNFPAASVGEPLTLVAVIHTPSGTTKLDWPVTPKR